MDPINKILVPVDFSPGSKSALEHALFLGHRFGAAVHVLHAWDIPGYVRPDLTVWDGDASSSLAEHARREAEQNMSEFLADAELPEQPVQVTSEIVSGTAYAAILQAIEQGGYDLVVMGTHGRTGLSHLMMGSVAEKVVRRSPVPVMTVRGAKGTGKGRETVAGAS